MVALSVVIITFNEEKNISRCIKSIQHLADEIVVVDSFSQDTTCQLAQELGARVLQHPFVGHIEQKNFALAQAQYHHILSLDADEAVDAELAQAILQAKMRWPADGYFAKRLTNYVGQWIYHCGWYPDWKLRLFDRRQAHWGGNNPHDIIVMNAAATVHRLPGNIQHYSYLSVSDHITQTNKFTSIAARAAFAYGVRSTTLQIIMRPILKFIRDFFIKGGIRDGRYGLIICLINALSTFLKYTKIQELQKGREI